MRPAIRDTGGVVGFSLGAYVPRLVAGWVATEPDVQHRVVNGTLASADISGFTKLAERLAGAGKVGGENLTFALNEVFTLLIDEAAGLGGDVLKFGGDALLILFSGDDHEARAVKAAALMQQAIESDRARDAAAGISLRMSVGVHTGPINLFLVGDEHRELIVAGPGATATAQLEDDAEAGMVLVGAACAAALPDQLRVATIRDDGAIEIDRAAALDLDVETPSIVPAPEPTGIELSPNLRNQVEAIEQIGGEHRRATVAFVRFQGVDDRIAAGDIDEVTRDLDALVRSATELSARYSSTLLYSDIYFDGGKFLLTAGAPTSSGHDEESMLRTVLALLEVETSLEMRAGINAGPLFAGFLGSVDRRTFTVMADDVNLAARLMQHAEPGTVLATDDTVSMAGSGFQQDPVEPFLVKGKTDPIAAGVVSTKVSRIPDADEIDDDLPFVGRDDVLTTLRELRADAEDGRGGAVVLSGGSGSGKTRLVQELLRPSADRSGHEPAVLRLVCQPYDELEAYATGHQLVRLLLQLDPTTDAVETGLALAARVAEVAPELEPWLPLLGVFAGANVASTPEVDAVDAAFRRDRLHHAVLDFLDVVLDESAILVIEDSHWLDEAMTAFVTWMASLVLSDRSWLVVLTTRTPVTEIDLAARTIALTPLRSKHLRELAVARIESMAGPGGGAVSDEAVDALVERSGGNPLFLLALASDPAAAAGRTGALPESVETLLTTRIDQLLASLRLQLRRAAVIGVTFSDELLQAVGVDGLVPWDPASDFVQLARGGNMRFRQALFRDVAYEGLPYRHRREVHGKLADYLIADDTDDVEQLGSIALHFHLAERHREAFEWTVRAADDAASKYANGSAAELYQRALGNADALAGGDRAKGVHASISPAEEVSACESLGAVLELAGRYADADVAYARAEALASDDVVRLGDLRRRRAVVKQNLGEPDAAMAGLESVLELLVDEPSDEAQMLRASTLLECARVRYFQTRYDDAINFGKQAVSAASLTDAKHTVARANMTLHLANVSLGSGEAAEYRDVALPIFEAIGDLVGQGNMLNNLGIESYYAGRWDEAADFYERSRTARDRCGDVIGAATSANNLAEILSDQGHLGDARSMLERALQDWTSSGFAVGIALATSNLGRVAARDGRTDDAERLLVEAERRFTDLGADDMALDARVRLAEAAALGHDAATAETRARTVLDGDPPPLAAAIAQRILGLAGAIRGDLGMALDALQQSSALALAEGLEYERVITEVVMAELRGRSAPGDVDGAVRRLGLVVTPEIQLIQGARASIAMGAVDTTDTELSEDDQRVAALAASELLGAVDPATIRELALRAVVRDVPAGGVLIRQGDRSDGTFLVMHGRFDVSAVRPGRGATSIGDVGRGEWIGEMAMLSDDRRTATVIARRNSQVLEISPAALIAVIGSHPDVLRGITTRLVQRLLSDRGERRTASAVPTIGCVAVHDGPAVDAVIDGLRRAMLDDLSAAAVLDAADVDRVAIAQAEAASDGVLVMARRRTANGSFDDVARLTINVADVVLLVTDSNAGMSGGAVGQIVAELGARAVEVVVAGGAGDDALATALGSVRPRRVHRCEPGDVAAARRVMRSATGRQTVAVLSGGGARALAHLGVADAWRADGTDIDAIVASGSGSVLGAAIAMGLSTSEAVAACAPLLVPSVGRRDVAFPRLALTSGASFTEGLREVFGTRRIEDLDVAFHAVATDVSSGTGVMISGGELWRAVRASAGTPGVVPPVRIGDAALVDGGVVDTFPVGRARSLYPKAVVIGSDVTASTSFTSTQLDDAGLVEGDDDAVSVSFVRRVGSRLLASRSSKRAAQRLTLTTTLQRLTQVRRDDGDGRRDAGDVAVRPPIEGFGAHEVDRADELVRLGNNAARAAIETHAIDAVH